MSTIATILAPWRAADTLAAVSEALEEAGLPEPDHQFGIQARPEFLAMAPTLPAIAVQCDRLRRGQDWSAGYHEVIADVTCWVAYGASDEPAVADDAESYADVIRTALEQTIRPDILRLAWRSTELQADRYISEHGLPTGVLMVKWEAATMAADDDE